MLTPSIRTVGPDLARLCLSLTVAVSWGAGVGHAKEESRESPTDYAPGRSLTIRLSLDEAANLAAKYSPDVNVARQRVFEDLGRLLEARGAFDASFGLQGLVDLQTRALTSDDLEIERAKRKLLRLVAEQYQGLADALSQGNERTRMRIRDYDDGAGPGAPRAPDDRICEDSLAAGMGDDAGYSIDDSLRDAYNDIAERARRTLRQIGLLPSYDAKTTLDFTLSYTKTCRNGLVVKPSLRLKAIQDNYIGKRLSAAWGGKGVKDAFRSTAGIGLTYPLGKGRGRVSTAAFEEAARSNLQASSHGYADAVAQSVLRTALAYWKLLEAQERAAWLTESCKRGDELIAIGETLVSAGQMTVPELAQIRARAFDSQARESKAEQDILTARLELATAMGVQVNVIHDAPLVSSSWPATPDSMMIASLRVQQLANYAVERRPDLRAATMRLAASSSLAAAARSDEKTTRNLDLGVSYLGLHEGGSINSPAALCRGYGDALFGYYPGPSFRVAVNVDIPFGNNVAKGKYAQASALKRQGAVQARDLERVIRGRVAQLVANLGAATLETRWRERAREHAREELDGEFERFRSGLTSASKMIQTVDDFESKELTLTESRLKLATVVSQLRFEMGVTLAYGIDRNGLPDVQEIRPGGYDFK